MMDEVSPDILFGTCGSSCADTTDVSASGCSQVGIEIGISPQSLGHVVLSSSTIGSTIRCCRRFCPNNPENCNLLPCQFGSWGPLVGPDLPNIELYPNLKKPSQAPQANMFQHDFFFGLR